MAFPSLYVDYPHLTGANVTHRRAPRVEPAEPEVVDLEAALGGGIRKAPATAAAVIDVPVVAEAVL